MKPQTVDKLCTAKRWSTANHSLLSVSNGKFLYKNYQKKLSITDII